MEGIQTVLKDTNVQFRIFYLNSRLEPSAEAIQEKVKTVLQLIEEWKPDVLLVSDDNAVKYVVEPHFRQGPIPVVFCGVNWTAAPYGLPTENVTGMVEVLPVRQGIETLRQTYPNLKKLIHLSRNTAGEQVNQDALLPIYQELGLEPEFARVDTFEQWKTWFKEANDYADVIYLPSVGGVEGWNEQEAAAFVSEHIRKPVLTCNEAALKFALLGMFAVWQEQGAWSARAAVEILQGRKPAEIPTVTNQQVQPRLNAELAEKIGYQPPDELAKQLAPVN
jgi:ABC-type uncharacterized transport system substrate-binding protein